MSDRDALFVEERKNRLENAYQAQLEVFKALLATCTTIEDTLLMIKLLSKKKNQIKLAVRWLFQNIMENFGMIVEQIDGKTELFMKMNTSDGQNKYKPSEEEIENNVLFFSTILSELIEGKLFLEQERIDYATYLQKVYEHLNMTVEALQIKFDVPIETFNQPMEEITLYQLDVFRLAIICQDKHKSEVLSKKIKEKFLKQQKDKIFNRLLRTDYFTMIGEYSKAAKELLKIIELKSSEIGSNVDQKMLEQLDLNKSEEKPKDFVKFDRFFKLSKYDGDLYGILIQQATFYGLVAIENVDEQSRIKLLNECKSSKYNVEKCRDLINLFLRKEIIEKENTLTKMVELCKQFRTFDESSNELEMIYKIIGNSIDLHNLALLSLFCQSITFSDLESLLQTPIEILIDLICNKQKNMKIDQKNELFFFNHQKNEIRIKETLEMLEESCLFVTKERLRRKVEQELAEKESFAN